MGKKPNQRGYDHPAIASLMRTIKRMIEDGQPSDVVDDVIRQQLCQLAAPDGGNEGAYPFDPNKPHRESLN